MSLHNLSKIISNATYREEIGSDQWRSFSRRIKSDRNCCQVCKRADVLLNVHHHFYDPERRLWDYADNEVSVLCEHCHKAMHEGLNKFRTWVFGYLTPQSIRVLNGAMALGFQQHDPLKFAYAIAELAASPRSIELFYKAFVDRPSKNSEVVKRAIETVATQQSPNA